MTIDVSINTPLTAVQSELTGKIGSMQSLLALANITLPTVPKSQQMSAYDYLLRLLEIMGVNPRFLFQVFMDKIFDENIIVEKIVSVFANMSAKRGKSLGNPSASVENPSQSVVNSLKQTNLDFLMSKIGAPMKQAFRVAKLLLVKEFTMMIFGKSENDSTNEYMSNTSVGGINHTSNQGSLLKESVCGAELFSLSTQPYVKEEDLEYNRIQVLQKIEKGQVEYKVSCQNVEVKLPDDPRFIFEGGGPTTVSGSPTVDPAKSLAMLIDHVGNEVQRQNSDKNSDSAANAFSKSVVEKLIQLAPTIFRPMFDQVFVFMANPAVANIAQTPGAQANYFGYDKDTMTSSACDILNDPENEEKKELSENLCNILLKLLIGILLTYLIGKVKKLAKDYFARKAMEKLKRRQDKLTQRFKIFKDLNDNSTKVEMLKRATAAIASLLIE